MQNKIRVIMLGIGRTGKEIASVLSNQPDIELCGAFCRSGGANVGRNLGELLGSRPSRVKVRGADALDGFLDEHTIDVAVDFTRPESTIQNFRVLSNHGVNAVIGTTGFTPLQLEHIKAIAAKHKTGVVYAPNITLGVNVLMVLTNLAVSILESYDCTIIETHFKDKVDAPSGTAKKIAAEAAKGMEAIGLDASDISIHAIRAGGIIGKHSVLMAGEFDKLEITHESFSRKAFAAGALRAVRQINGKSGYYEMQDVLNLQRVMRNFINRSTSSAPLSEPVIL